MCITAPHILTMRMCRNQNLTLEKRNRMMLIMLLLSLLLLLMIVI